MAIKQLETIMAASGALECRPSALAHAIDAQPYDRDQLRVSINEDELGGAWAELERSDGGDEQTEIVGALRVIARDHVAPSQHAAIQNRQFFEDLARLRASLSVPSLRIRQLSRHRQFNSPSKSIGGDQQSYRSPR